MTFNKAQGRSLEGFFCFKYVFNQQKSLMFVALFVSEKIVKQPPKASFIKQKVTLNESKGLRL